MPGLNQLKKFSEDVSNLGNELSVRSGRGEPPVTVPLPEGIAEADDSEDFVLGLPEDNDNAEALTGGDGTDSDNTDGNSDIDGSFDVNSLNSSADGDSLDMSDFPELDSILNPLPEDPDLSEFTDVQTDFLSDMQSSMEVPPSPDAALPPDAELPPDVELSSDVPNAAFPSDIEFPPDTGETLQDLSDFELPDFDLQEQPVTDDDSSAFSEPVPDTDNFSFSDIPMDSLFDEPIAPNTVSATDEFDDFAQSGPEVSLSDDFSEPDFSFEQLNTSEQDSFGIPNEPDTDFSSDGTDSDIKADTELGDVSSMSDSAGQSGFSMPEIPDFDLETLEGAGFDDVDSASEGLKNSFGDFNANPSSGSGDDEFSVPEVFDIPQDPFGADASFSDEDSASAGFASESDDDVFGDFDIPGFSDHSAGSSSVKNPSKAFTAESRREKNTLTDSEYKTFLKNLSDYPLNIRVALEEFIVNNEFTDDTVFEVIEKVLKKASARQIASHLEKLMDISLSVPRDFERRTFEQYEEYKKSVEYQLKNRILPGILLCAMTGVVVFLLFLFGKYAVYNPLKAESLYKQGYALLENNEYPQSELKFNEALTYQPKKKWFFRYAQGYRAHRQYERARSMYKAILSRFKHDKQAGLDYAEMELYDLRNFENAETIVRREILDYHINDKDGLLLLGDIFLDWGDERDPAKYEAAFEIYNDLAQLYGQNDLYLSRMLRYFIRVDDLRNVLQLKNHFYPKKKSLGGQDLVELSGYLLDKLYGDLPASDEYLRSSIEDVRDLLEQAASVGADIPESKYNLARYFIQTGNRSAAKLWMQEAIDAFGKAETRSRKRLNRQINAYRLLGELYGEEHEYLTAEDLFRAGIQLYEKERAAGLSGDVNTGMLYTDMGDLDYFISGDFDEALKNYLSAVQTKYDTPSVRYKIGYIQYSKKNYAEALGSFIKASESKSSDTHLLLALANVLSLRGNNFAAQGYYEKLLQILDSERSRYGIMFPQVNTEHADIVDMYLKASNNLGVTQYRLARQKGDSALNAQAMVNLTMSLRAWDAMTRNQETMTRLSGTNLAERNIAYMSHPVSEYEPSIYTEIPRVLTGESVSD